MVIASYALLLLAASLVSTHSASDAPKGDALLAYRSENLHSARSLHRRCAPQLEARRAKRDVRHNLARRSLATHYSGTEGNSSCSLTPEVTQGPYHILGELYRQNITAGQAGVPLQVEIDLIDVETCEPVSAFIDSWHANATGFYSGYVSKTGSALSGGDSSGGDGFGGNSTMDGPDGNLGNSTTGGNSTDGDSRPPSGGSGGSRPSGSDGGSTNYTYYSGADSSSAALALNVETTDKESFLRGVWHTDEEGHASVASIVPGWYSGRAQHYHIKVYPDGYIASNGTFVATGSAVHVGQFFFDNDTLEAVAATYPYTENAIDWSDHVSNGEDQWYPYQAAEGYNADMDITWVGADITDGLIGYIAVGLNTSYSAVELSTQYYSGDIEEALSESDDATSFPESDFQDEDNTPTEEEPKSDLTTASSTASSDTPSESDSASTCPTGRRRRARRSETH